MNRAAIISPCGQFRYWLRRQWGGDGTLLYVMLNPSTADADVDDATVRRCIRFARDHGFGAMEVVNLFAHRATKPADLRAAGFPVGPNNDISITAAAKVAGRVAASAAMPATVVKTAARVWATKPSAPSAKRVNAPRWRCANWPPRPTVKPSRVF